MLGFFYNSREAPPLKRKRNTISNYCPNRVDESVVQFDTVALRHSYLMAGWLPIGDIKGALATDPLAPRYLPQLA